jgi:hypothetical protein
VLDVSIRCPNCREFVVVGDGQHHFMSVLNYGSERPAEFTFRVRDSDILIHRCLLQPDTSRSERLD